MSSARAASFFWIFFLFILQNSVLYLFPEKTPALVLIGILYYSMFEGSASGFAAGIWGGFLLDLFSQGRPGFFMIAFGACGAACGVISSKIFEDSWLSEIILPVVSLYGVLLARILLLRASEGEPFTLSVFSWAFQPWLFLTTALAAPWIFARLRKLSPRQRYRRTVRV